MRALQVTRNARPTEALEIVDVDVPEPGPGQVRVAVHAASLNFNDIDRCHGRVTTIPMPPPFTLGMDVCGVVDAAGEGGEAWVGKRVSAITQMAQGGIAEYAGLNVKGTRIVCALLYLTPRGTSILRDVFGAGTEETDAGAETPASSPVADRETAIDNAVPAAEEVDETVELPRYQRQMYRKDI